jgi:hypothetical protein
VPALPRPGPSGPPPLLELPGGARSARPPRTSRRPCIPVRARLGRARPPGRLQGLALLEGAWRAPSCARHLAWGVPRAAPFLPATRSGGGCRARSRTVDDRRKALVVRRPPAGPVLRGGRRRGALLRGVRLARAWLAAGLAAVSLEDRFRRGPRETSRAHDSRRRRRRVRLGGPGPERGCFVGGRRCQGRRGRSPREARTSGPQPCLGRLLACHVPPPGGGRALLCLPRCRAVRPGCMGGAAGWRGRASPRRLRGTAAGPPAPIPALRRLARASGAWFRAFL